MLKSKKLLPVILSLLCLTLCSCAASGSDISSESTAFSMSAETTKSDTEASTVPTTQPPAIQETPTQTEDEPMNETMFYIKANGTTFAADFAENSSADALRELLHEGDLTIDMHDYGSFEKVGEIGRTLPQNNTQITTEPGDVILYLGTNITIYYDENSWNFTRLGKIQDVTKNDLLSVFGDGNVMVTLSLSE